ncbi:MAG TPA: hypothetical protein VF618_13000 [Thermoanaerobaculia bacterium]
MLERVAPALIAAFATIVAAWIARKQPTTDGRTSGKGRAAWALTVLFAAAALAFTFVYVRDWLAAQGPIKEDTPLTANFEATPHTYQTLKYIGFVSQ